MHTIDLRIEETVAKSVKILLEKQYLMLSVYLNTLYRCYIT